MRLSKIIVSLIPLFFALNFNNAQANFNSQHAPGELLVKFKENVSVQDIALFSSSGVTRDIFPFTGISRFVLTKGIVGKELENVAAKLSESPAVEWVEPNYIIRVESDPLRRKYIPNDKYFDSLYGLFFIQMPLSWNVQTGSKDVVVAVPDTGIDLKHPELIDNLWKNSGETGVDESGNDKSTNGIDDDGNGYIDDWCGWDFVFHDNDPMDDYGHGTHVMGIIGAEGDNVIGISGINWDISLLPLRFMDGLGEGTVAKAVLAIEYAVEKGAHFINASWGMDEPSEAIKEAIQLANEAGILFVAAAGNSYESNDKHPKYPASFDLENIISVAASDRHDELAFFSNYGEKTVHLAAPGEAIISTVIDGYAVLDGTSMAAPHVTGALALIKAQYPNADMKELKSRVLDSVDYSVEFKDITITGGRLNVYRALQY
ncbi:S8 family peptidase [Bdellovibrionota bacterium]